MRKLFKTAPSPVRWMLMGALLTGLAVGIHAARAAIPLPSVQGPFLGDQNANIYTLAKAINEHNQQNTTSGLVAFAGGGQASATQLAYGLNQVATVATTADSVKLPACSVGAIVYLTNDGANSTTVYGASGRTDTINGTAGATGVAQAAAAHAFYICAVPDSAVGGTGKWTTIRANS